MHFPALLNMFTQCDVIKNCVATSRHTVSIIYIFVAFITEIEVFVVVFR